MPCESEHGTYVQTARVFEPRLEQVTSSGPLTYVCEDDALIGNPKEQPRRIGFGAKAAGVACFLALVGGVARLFKGGLVKGDVQGEMGFTLVGHNTGEAEPSAWRLKAPWQPTMMQWPCRERRLILTWERPLRMNF